MAEIESCLPQREEFEFYSTDSLECAADQFAGEIVADGIVSPDQHDNLAVALVRSGLYCLLGLAVNEEVLKNEAREKYWQRKGHGIKARTLMRPPGNRPKEYGFQGLIWVLANAWEFFGLKPKPPADDPCGNAERDSPFSKVCKEWYRRVVEIDTASTSPLDKVLISRSVRRRPPAPKRSVFRRVLNERKKSLGT